MDSDTGEKLADSDNEHDDGADETRECELADCAVRFPRRGKKKFCTKEHANEAARRRTVLEGLAVDVPLEELRALRDEVLERVGPCITALAGDLTALLDRFAALETGAVARIAAAEKTAADATAAEHVAEQAAAAAADREAAAVRRAEQDRTARIHAEQAQATAEGHARAATEDRVRAEATRDAAVERAAAAESRADLSALATLEATGRAAQERARADALRAELDRVRAEHTAEVRRLGEEARTAADAVRARADAVLRQVGEQTDARIEGLRARHNTEVEQVRATAAAEVTAARAEAREATDRYTEAVLRVERERAAAVVERDQLIRRVRSALSAALVDQPDLDVTAEARMLRLRDGVGAVLGNLDGLADRADLDQEGGQR